MLKVTYDPKFGRAQSDGEVETFYQEYIPYMTGGSGRPDSTAYHLRFSTSLIFDRIRVGIAEGEIPHDKVVFVFDQQEIPINRDGSINRWPKGFLDLGMDLLMRLLP